MTAAVSNLKVLQAIIGEFDAVDEYLKAVGEILRDGHMPDMGGLDERVSYLCNAVQSADPDIQQRCLPKLDDLLRKLDICESEVRAFGDKKPQSGQQ